MGRVLVSTFGISRTVFIPVGIFVFPVREPIFFGFGVHRLQIESSIVCNKCLKAFVVVSCEPVNAKTTEAGTYAAKPVFINEGKVFHGVVNGREIVAHAEPGPIAGDFFVPFRAETR